VSWERELTEFGAVDFTSRQTFHGTLFESRPNPNNPAHSEVTGRAFDPVKVFTDFEQWLLSVTNGRYIFVSDNPAYDFQWINYGFHHAIGRSPFGHSGRRISDLCAGLVGVSTTARPGKGFASLPTITIPSMTRWGTSKPLHDYCRESGSVLKHPNKVTCKILVPTICTGVSYPRNQIVDLPFETVQALRDPVKWVDDRNIK
jgi:hypothetical protein